MAEVMRKAQAGERIKIVAPEVTFGDYDEGDEFVVRERNRGLSEGVLVDIGEDEETLIYDREYVVIEEKFEVGDFVVGLPSADEHYYVTAPKNNYVGRVVGVGHDGYITLETVASDETWGNLFTVRAKYFRKATEEEIPSEYKPAKGEDPVEHPSHYTAGAVEVIKYIEQVAEAYDDGYVAYCVGNVLKYVSRAPHKHESPLEDLHKARKYLDFAIEHIEGKE